MIEYATKAVTSGSSGLIWRRAKHLTRVLLTLALLALALNACVSSRLEPFAPELKKRYLVTQELVITRRDIPPPLGIFLGNEGKPAKYVMSHERFDLVNSWIPESSLQGESPYPLEGVIHEGSRVRVRQLFTYSNPTGSTRFGKLDLTDAKTGDTLTAYTPWEDIVSHLKEDE